MNTPGINWKEAKYKGSVLNDINYYEVSDKGMIRYRKKSAIANNVSEWKFKSIEEKRYSVVTISKKNTMFIY